MIYDLIRGNTGCPIIKHWLGGISTAGRAGWDIDCWLKYVFLFFVLENLILESLGVCFDF